MKLQIDTDLRIIKIEELINFGELIEVLEKLLPNQWKEYKLETGTIIYWTNPIQIIPIEPYRPYPYYPQWPIITCNSGTHNIEIK
jgi:hypothetical protein